MHARRRSSSSRFVVALALACIATGSATRAGTGDSDADGIPDAADNCPADPNALQEDLDGDGAGDVCDVDPTRALFVRMEGVRRLSMANHPYEVSFDLVDADGTPVDDLPDARIRLRSEPSAVRWQFDAPTTVGELLTPFDLYHPLVRFEDGRIRCRAQWVGPGGEPILTVATVDFEDAEHQGLGRFGVVRDFETSGDGFVASGWERGTPTSGPGAAASGANVWATDLDDPVIGGTVSTLTLPGIAGAGNRALVAEFASWFDGGCCDGGRFEQAPDGGAWSTLASYSGSPGGYATESVTIPPTGDGLWSLRLVFDAPTGGTAGWFVDDFVLREGPFSTTYIGTGNSDPDGDFLRNLDDPDPLDPDTDDDGRIDGFDNCPAAANPDQANLVHPNRVQGDACDDPDGDGYADAVDNCPGTAQADLADVDLDGRGDACDPVDDRPFGVLPDVPAFLPWNGSAVARFSLLDPRGNPIESSPGVRAGIALDQGAIFGSAAVEGTLLSGGGTSSIVAEFVDGAFAIEISRPGTTEALSTISVQDPEGIGIALVDRFGDDFEAGPGGFAVESPSGATCGWTFPATDAATPYRGSFWDGICGVSSIQQFLESPAYPVPRHGSPRLDFFDSGSSLVEAQAEGLPGWTPVVDGDLGPFAGRSTRFRVQASRVDDWIVGGFVHGVRFVDPLGDDDGDGVTAADELAQGSDPSLPDTDADGLADGLDNCPSVANPDQIDTTPADGIGDLCQDADLDGVPNATDNCLDVANPAQSDPDGDLRGDACDAYPLEFLRARIDAPDFAFVGVPAPLAVHVETLFGPSSAPGARYRLRAIGPATFGATASTGALVSGGGTDEILFELDGGLFEIDLVTSAVGEVSFEGIDEDDLGIVDLETVDEDFDAANPRGVLGCEAYPWERGAPFLSPASAYSVPNVCGTDLNGTVLGGVLSSPEFSLPRFASPSVGFRSWLGVHPENAPLLLVSKDGGTLWSVLDAFEPTPIGGASWNEESVALDGLAGGTVRLQWHLVSDGSPVRGWYLDDLVLEGLRPVVRSLLAGADEDEDGIPNHQEAAQGSDPLSGDGDGDGVADAADLCPTIWDASQDDLVVADGVGDACSDADADGVPDATDVCPFVPDTAQSDTDRDLVGDACDPYPQVAFVVRPRVFQLPRTGVPLPVRLELFDENGIDRIEPVDVELAVDGAATIVGSTTPGAILSGAGTATATVRIAGSDVTVLVSTPLEETVTLRGRDVARNGVRFTGSVVESFDRGPGGFVPDAAPGDWSWGERVEGPAGAYSGRRVWSTDLDYVRTGSSRGLESPWFPVGPAADPTAAFRARIDAPGGGGTLTVRVRTPTTGWVPLATLTTPLSGWTEVVAPLAAYTEQLVRFRWEWNQASSPVSPFVTGARIDQFEIRGNDRRVDFVAAFPPERIASLRAGRTPAGGVALSWTPPPGGPEADLAQSYRVERASDPQGPFDALGTTSGTGWEDDGDCGTALCVYRVVAINGAGETP